MKIYLFIFLQFSAILTFAQQDTAVIVNPGHMSLAEGEEIRTKNPMLASLYSSVLPGLGQFYNEQYWKVPIVLGAVGTGIGVTIFYNNRHLHYRNAYVSELNNQPHEYSGIYSREVLARIQDEQRRNRDYAIAASILIYALGVLDATVDAHLYDIRRDRELSVEPVAMMLPNENFTVPGVALRWNLK